MIHLDMNKTKFLRLLEEKTMETRWADLPERPRAARFWRVERKWEYFLEWSTDEGFFRAYLARVDEKPKLSLERIEEGRTIDCQVYDLDMDQLLAEEMAIDPESSFVYLTNAERERLKARFARITAKLKDG